MNRRITEPRAGRWVTLAFSAAVTLCGCAATTPPDLDPRLEAAAAVFGGRFDYVYVPSGGRLADQAFLAMSRVAGPHQLARDLASIMAAAETRPIRVMVTGPAGAKTLRVVLDALSFHEGRRLPHLELLYLGEPAHEALLARKLSEVGAVLRFAPYRE